MFVRINSTRQLTQCTMWWCVDGNFTNSYPTEISTHTHTYIQIIMSNWFVQNYACYVMSNNLTCLLLEIFNDLQIDTNRKFRE